MATCLSATCFPDNSWNSNKSHHIFVCPQYPVFGQKRREPAEISFTNRWELVGPLGWETRFSRFSQECCRNYWFSGEKKITIQTCSAQFLGACRKRHPINVIAFCRELLLNGRYWAWELKNDECAAHSPPVLPQTRQRQSFFQFKMHTITFSGIFFPEVAVVQCRRPVEDPSNLGPTSFTNSPALGGTGSNGAATKRLSGN